MRESTMTGYLSAQYASTFSWVGQPHRLPASGGHVIVRKIPETEFRDAVGCYPIFCCQDWEGLSVDLSKELQDVVSVTLVTDPFLDWCPKDLESMFDHVVRYKSHALVDLADTSRRPSAHHRRRLASARSLVNVLQQNDGLAIAETWVALYESLSARHEMSLMSSFPRHALEGQLSVPGLRTFSASLGEETVCVTLWYVQGNVAYYHLGASSENGYRSSASYAVFDRALAALAEEGVRWADLGAGAGIAAKAATEERAGLERFKMGWATETRDVFICGRIIQPDVYDKISKERVLTGRAYFPSYREPRR